MKQSNEIDTDIDMEKGGELCLEDDHCGEPLEGDNHDVTDTTAKEDLLPAVPEVEKEQEMRSGDSTLKEEEQDCVADNDGRSSSCSSSIRSEGESYDHFLMEEELRQQQQQQAPHGLPKAFRVSDNTLLASEMGDSSAEGSAYDEAWGDDNYDHRSTSSSGGQRQEPSPKWAIGGLIFLCFIVVGMVVGNKAAETELLNSSSCKVMEPFRKDLHVITLQAMRKDPCSPQNKANLWMRQDPNVGLYPRQRQLQRFALVTLWFATSGDQWEKNNIHYDGEAPHSSLWLRYHTDECRWYNQAGATEDDQGRTERTSAAADAAAAAAAAAAVCDGWRMHTLKLTNLGLQGELPHELLYYLPALTSLDLSHNSLQGDVPVLFAADDSYQLERLVLSSNQLTGRPVVEQVLLSQSSTNVTTAVSSRETVACAAASNLTVLQLDDNQLEGPLLPPELLQEFPNLAHINITGNQFTGSLPSGVNQWKDTLHTLEIADNPAVTGSLPSQLGALTQIQVLDLGGNPQLGGTIPVELSNLMDLTRLDISNTSIVGSLPQYLCLRQKQGQLQVLADCSTGSHNHSSFECCGGA